MKQVTLPMLCWVTGLNSIAETQRLSAAFSERGLPNRWIPLYRRPSLWEAALSQPWNRTFLQACLREVPILLLSDTEDRLKALWETLHNQGLIEETLFLVRHYRHPLFQEGPLRLSPETAQAWLTSYEDLAPDIAAAVPWQPCQLLSVLA